MGERKINGLDDFVAMINRSPDLTPGHVSFEIKMRGGYMVIAAFLVRNPITTDNPNELQPTLSRLLSTSTFPPTIEWSTPCYHGTPRPEVVQLGKTLIRDFLNSTFYQRCQQIRSNVSTDLALSNMRNLFVHYLPNEMLDFLQHFRDHCNKHLFMDFEGDEGNVIILSFSAFSDFDEQDTVYVCACDKRSEAWATSIHRFITIIEDPKIRKYYMDDPGHSDIRIHLIFRISLDIVTLMVTLLASLASLLHNIYVLIMCPLGQTL